MVTSFLRRCLVVGLIGLSAASSGADEPSWHELSIKAAELYQRKQYSEAVKVAEQALDVSKKTFGPGDVHTAKSLELLGRVHSARGKDLKALHLYQRALAIWERAFGPRSPEIANILILIAKFYMARGEPIKAWPLCERALTIQETALGPDHPEVASILMLLAELHLSQGQAGKAGPLYQRALNIQEQSLGPEHPEVATTLSRMVQLYTSEGEPARAEPLRERAAALLEKIHAADRSGVTRTEEDRRLPSSAHSQFEETHPRHQRLQMLAQSLTERSAAYVRLGEYREAEKWLREAIAIYEKLYGPHDPHVVAVLESHAAILRKAGRVKEAESMEAWADNLRSGNIE
jgi:tetratricopeptide (TPR) repeat protein